MTKSPSPKRLARYAGAAKSDDEASMPPSNDKAYTFDDVARLVCKGADPPPALAISFQRWAHREEGYWGYHRADEMTRRQVVAELKKIGGATEIILKGLDTWAGNFILSPKYEFFDRATLAKLLQEIESRCRMAISSPALASKNGRVRPGPGAVARLSGVGSRTLCARTIVMAWREINGKTPCSRYRYAVEAAQALYSLMTDSEKGLTPKLRRTSGGKKLAESWKKHFQAAKRELPDHEWTIDIYLFLLRAAFIEFGYPARGEAKAT